MSANVDLQTQLLAVDLAATAEIRIAGMRHAAPDTGTADRAALDKLAARNSYEVICGRLYFPTDLQD